MKSVAGQVRAGFAHMTTCDALSTTLVTLPSIFLHVFRLISATTCGLTSISPEPARSHTAQGGSLTDIPSDDVIGRLPPTGVSVTFIQYKHCPPAQ